MGNIPFSPAKTPSIDTLASVPVHVALSFDFSDWQAIHPTQPLPGASVDAEFLNGYAATNNLMDRLAMIQRDDGSLYNGIVTLESMDPATVEYFENLAEDSAASAADAAAAQAAAAAAQAAAQAAANSANAADASATSGAAAANASAVAADASADAAAASAALMPPLPNTPDSTLTTDPTGAFYLLRTSLLLDPNDAKWDALNHFFKNVPPPAADTDVMRRIDVKSNTPYLDVDGKLDAAGHAIKNAGAAVNDNDLTRKIDVQGLISGAGSVPPPSALDVNKPLIATGDNTFTWVAFLTDMISDATAFMRNLLKTVDDAAEFRVAIDVPSNAAVTAAVAAKQDTDPMLTALSALVTAANDLAYFTGPDAVALTQLSAFMRTVLDDVDAATARATLGVPATAAVQPVDATLTTIAALAPVANEMIYFTGADVAARTSLTAFARTLLDDADAATARATLGAEIIGKQSFLIPASSLIPHPSSGPTAVAVATANGQIYRAMRFADGLTQICGIPIPLPKKVDVTQAMSVRLRYTASAAGNARWNFGVRAVSDGDAIDAAATAASVTSTIVANTQETTVETAIGIPTGIAKEDTAFLYVQRLGADGADTLAANADLLTVELICAIDKGNNA